MFSADPPLEMTLEVRGYPQCENCESEFVAIFPTPNLTHYAKALCVGCGQFRVWVPHPDRPDRIRRQLADIEFAKTEAWDDAWAWKFLDDIENRLKTKPDLTPKQTKCLDDVLGRYISKEQREWMPAEALEAVE